MDLAFSPAEEAFRAELRGWLRAHLPPSAEPATLTAWVPWAGPRTDTAEQSTMKYEESQPSASPVPLATTHV